MILLVGLIGLLFPFISDAQNLGSCHNFDTCCDPAVYSSCLGDPATSNCYCDQICYEFNDCCADIGSNCLATSNEPTADTGSCVNVGYDGCCNPNTHVTCKGDDSICYCDQVCFQYGDCCSDIHQIGCYINANSPSATETPQGSCTAAGFESCCNPSDSSNCYGSPPTCYCDAACFEFNDCCSDISQVCTLVGTPTAASQGTCTGLGFTSGCCVPTADENCHGTDGICYCDQICYNFGDCCPDIEEINCLNIQPTGNEGSCVSKGFEGCCDPQISSECYGSAGTTCYCDELCYQFDDCCSDIAQIGCLQPSGNPTPNNGSCLLAGHLSCCSLVAFEPCLGSDGICHCDANCFEYGDCCKDIAFLQCTAPTNPNKGSCKKYTECCHPYNQDGTSCYGDPQTCYCDSLCFLFGDCCDDVTSIGCVAPTNVVPNTGSCAAAGYKSCCVPTDDQKCLGYPETCHCDAICHKYGDCCSDVIDIGCTSEKGSCVATGRTSCCLSDDPDCTGVPANCMCDQACSDRGDCCSDIGNLKDCTVVPGKVPGPVNNLMVFSLSDTSLNVTWEPPDDANGANTYLLRLQNYSKTPFDHFVRKSISIYSKQLTLDGLSPYWPYNISVVAVNEYGNGKRRMRNAFTKEGVPNVAPRDIKVIRSDKNTVTVTWTPLNLTEARGFVTGYKITYSSLSSSRRQRNTNEQSGIAGPKDHSYVISGLDALKKYGVTVAGMTKVGYGYASKMTYEEGPSSSVIGPSSSDIGQPSSSDIGLPSSSDKGLPSSSDKGLPSSSDKGLPSSSDKGLPSSSDIGPPSSSRSAGSTNYGAILGIAFGIFGLILILLAVIFIVVLVFWKLRASKGTSVSAKTYTRLLMNSSDDDDDDDEMID